MPELLARIRALAGNLKRVSPTWQRRLLVLATFVFIGGLALSIRAEPGLFEQIRMRPLLLLLLVIVPGQLALNAIEFLYISRSVGADVSPASSLQINIFGALANMLPVPGATITRVVALRMAGVPAATGTLVMLIFALFWVGLNSVYSGGWLLALGMGYLGTIVIAAGAVVTAITLIIVFQFEAMSLRATIPALVCRLLSIVLDAFRVIWAFLALGSVLPFAEASVLTIGSVLGNAASVVPAGLGVREVVLAALAPLVAARASTAFLAATLTRLVVLVALGPAAAILAVIGAGKLPAAKSGPGP